MSYKKLIGAKLWPRVEKIWAVSSLSMALNWWGFASPSQSLSKAYPAEISGRVSRKDELFQASAWPSIDKDLSPKSVLVEGLGRSVKIIYPYRNMVFFILCGYFI